MSQWLERRIRESAELIVPFKPFDHFDERRVGVLSRRGRTILTIWYELHGDCCFDCIPDSIAFRRMNEDCQRALIVEVVASLDRPLVLSPRDFRICSDWTIAVLSSFRGTDTKLGVHVHSIPFVLERSSN